MRVVEELMDFLEEGVVDILCNSQEKRVVFLLKEIDDLEKDILKRWERMIRQELGRFKVEFLEIEELFGEDVFKNFLEARSLIDERPFIDKLGLKLLVEYRYSLKHLPQSKKMMFTYALEGRRGMKGVLHELNGMKLAKSVVLIPKENSRDFEKFLNRWGVKYKKRKVVYEEI